MTAATPIHIVFLLVSYLLAGDVGPDGGFTAVHIQELPFPADTTLADCEGAKAPALLDAITQGEVDENAVFIAAKCEEMILIPTSGG